MSLHHPSMGNMEEVTLFVNGVQVYLGAPIECGKHQVYALSPQDREALTTGKNTLGILATCKNSMMKHFNAGVYTHMVDQVEHHLFASFFPDLLTPHYGEQKVKQLKELNAQLQVARLERNRGGVRYMKLAEGAHLPPSYVHLRGSVHGKGDPVDMAVPAVMVPTDDAATLPVNGEYEKMMTHGRRLALARWITSKENPLTARVMVNRLWQHCFGVGIVPTANDFGVLGESPTHQALLDWLAVEFMEKGWRVKPLLKTLLTSQAYLRSSAPNEAAVTHDPMNHWQWKHHARRLTAEEMRDTFLVLSGELRLEKPTVAYVRPKMPEEVLSTSSTPKTVWPETAGPEAQSRSVYVHVKRSMQLPLLSAFDAPQRDTTCPSRFATTVPTQALTMLNSEFINTRAARFSTRLMQTHEHDAAAQMKAGFQCATGRLPSMEEEQELLTLYQELQTDHGADAQTALSRVCLLLLNLNETIYLD